MINKIFNFTETKNAFNYNGINLKDIEFNNLRLLVKAHEKEIYEFGDDKVIARPHKFCIIYNDNYSDTHSLI